MTSPAVHGCVQRKDLGSSGGANMCDSEAFDPRCAANPLAHQALRNRTPTTTTKTRSTCIYLLRGTTESSEAKTGRTLSTAVKDSLNTSSLTRASLPSLVPSPTPSRLAIIIIINTRLVEASLPSLASELCQAHYPSRRAAWQAVRTFTMVMKNGSLRLRNATVRIPDPGRLAAQASI